MRTEPATVRPVLRLEMLTVNAVDVQSTNVLHSIHHIASRIHIEFKQTPSVYKIPHIKKDYITSTPPQTPLTLQARPYPFDTQQVEGTNTTQQGQSSTQPCCHMHTSAGTPPTAFNILDKLSHSPQSGCKNTSRGIYNIILFLW